MHVDVQDTNMAYNSMHVDVQDTNMAYNSKLISFNTITNDMSLNCVILSYGIGKIFYFDVRSYSRMYL